MGKGLGAKPYRGYNFPDFFPPNTANNFPFHNECWPRPRFDSRVWPKKSWLFSIQWRICMHSNIYHHLFLMIKSIMVSKNGQGKKCAPIRIRTFLFPIHSYTTAPHLLIYQWKFVSIHSHISCLSTCTVQGKILKLEQLMRSSNAFYWLGQKAQPMGR